MKKSKVNNYFCKYQWSYFLDNNRNSQVVVRCNNSKQLENAILKVIPLIKKIKKEVNGIEIEESLNEVTTQAQQPQYQQPAPQPTGGLTATCEIHKDAGGNPVKLIRKISKAGKEYWSHSRRLPNGEWDICFGKHGWESERQK